MPTEKIKEEQEEMNTWKKFSEERPEPTRRIWLIPANCKHGGVDTPNGYLSHFAYTQGSLWCYMEPPPPLPKDEPKCPHCKEPVQIRPWAILPNLLYGACSSESCLATGPLRGDPESALKAFCEVGK